MPLRFFPPASQVVQIGRTSGAWMPPTAPVGGGEEPFSGPLDAYSSGMIGLWSVARRLLASHAGALIRVRRTGDNAEADFSALDTGDLDTTTLIAWVVAGGGTQHGYISKIYDQSGAGLDLEQANAATQRQIVASGVVRTVSGIPTAYASANDQGYATATFSGFTNDEVSSFMVGSITDYSFSRGLGITKDAAGDFDNASRMSCLLQNLGAIMAYRSSALSAVSYTPGDLIVSSTIADGTNITVNNGASSAVSASSGNFDWNRILVGMLSASTAYCQAGDCWSEGVVYSIDKTSDEAAIRSALTP